MNIVLHTPVYDAIHTAYAIGSTIAGTSAGAAIMSEKMITGKELTDTSYNATFKKNHQKIITISSEEKYLKYLMDINIILKKYEYLYSQVLN